jgi:phage portal protein BeeE
VRLIDRMLSSRGTGTTYWEGAASGAAQWSTTYGSPNLEATPAQFADWAKRVFDGNGVVFAAEIIRMAFLSEASFQFQANDDNHLFGNPSLGILERPWPNGTSGELIGRMEQHAGVLGNAYTWQVPDEDRLVQLRPDWTTIVSELVHPPGGGEYRRKIGYFVQDPAKVPQDDGFFYPAEQVAHWAPIPDPYATFRGMSWLTSVVRDIAGDDGLTTYKVKYLENSASPNMLIKYASKLQPGTIDSVRERMQARYGGVDNAFKTLVLDQGADVTVIGNSLQQMDFANVGAAGAERILAASGVPGVLVGVEPLRGAGRGYQESMQRFANLWARPAWRSLCGCLEQICPPPGEGARLWFDTADIAALQDGELERGQAALVNAQALLTLSQAGYDRMSAVKAVMAADWSQLKESAVPAVLPAGNVQHMLPQTPPGVTAAPLPNSKASLPVGSTSPGDGGNGTRPAPQPSAGRRAITAGVNGRG